MGALPPWGTIELSVFCFNDMCGQFEDNMNIHVEGLPSDRLVLPMAIGVVGSPLSFSSSTVGMRRNPDGSPFVEFSPVPVLSGQYRKPIRIENEGMDGLPVLALIVRIAQVCDDVNIVNA